MSVIITGFEKPINCYECPFNNSDCWCNITRGRIDRDDWTCDKECPIKPLPKGHGRLIDADALMRDYGNPDIKILLDNMDTIIEADKTESEDKNVEKSY